MCVEFLYGDVIESVDYFGNIVSFLILILLVQEHRGSFCCPVSLISFFGVLLFVYRSLLLPWLGCILYFLLHLSIYYMCSYAHIPQLAYCGFCVLILYSATLLKVFTSSQSSLTLSTESRIMFSLNRDS